MVPQQRGQKENKMSNETATPENTPENGPDPRNILCRVVDVNGAIQNSFMRFVESENKSLEDLAMLLRDEMSKIELFAPTLVNDKTEG